MDEFGFGEFPEAEGFEAYDFDDEVAGTTTAAPPAPGLGASVSDVIGTVGNVASGLLQSGASQNVTFGVRSNVGTVQVQGLPGGGSAASGDTGGVSGWLLSLIQPEFFAVVPGLGTVSTDHWGRPDKPWLKPVLGGLAVAGALATGYVVYRAVKSYFPSGKRR